MTKKSILFICPIFYNYHDLIKNELIRQGYDVSFHTERSYGFLYAFIKNFIPRLENSFQKWHLKRVLKKNSHKKFDILLVVKGYNLPVFFIQELEARNPGIRKIMYQWDSNANNPFFHLIDYFDRVISFDYMDCQQNTQLDYVPLFYIEDKTKNSDAIRYQYLFIGVYTPYRYEVAHKLSQFAKANHQSFLISLYINPATYIKHFFKLYKADHSLLTFKIKSLVEISALVDQSQIIIDLSHAKQSGMSMRIIEALSKSKTIVTSNIFISALKEFKSYIHYFNFDNFDDFKNLQVNTADIDKSLLYTLEDWIKEILKED